MAALPSARAAAICGGGASGCSGTLRASVRRPSAFWLPSEILRISLYSPGYRYRRTVSGIFSPPISSVGMSKRYLKLSIRRSSLTISPMMSTL